MKKKTLEDINVFDVAVDPGTTHWWLIGHQGGNVVYSSMQDLNGIEMYTVQPYDIPGAELEWNIPANLDGFVNGTGYSFDWWAQTINNHHTHTTLDGVTSHLGLFSSPGYDIGSIAVNVYSNEIPNGETPIPEPTTMLLFGFGLLGLVGVGRKKLIK